MTSPLFRSLFWPALSAVALTQAPLYFSNQHQYFLHGLARGGLGTLGEDWLANTVDPTPLFSAGVAFGHRSIGDFSFRAAFFLLAAIYFGALFRIAADLLPKPPDSARVGLLAAALLVLHSGAIRVASVRLIGVDYPWFLQGGIAGQYLLGNYLQPSAFGILFLVSLACFARERWIGAALACCLPAIVHATYLMPAAFLTIGFLTSLLLRGRRRAALAVGLGNLLLVLPAVYAAWRTFAPTSPAEFAEAERILAEVRIPHHARIARWFDGVVLFQLAWIALGLLCLRRTPYFAVLAVAFGLGTALSLFQYFTASQSLALLFPWRITALLVPVATAAVAARMVASIPPQSARHLGQIGLVLSVAAAFVGIAIPRLNWGYRQGEVEIPMLDFVRDNHRPGDVYLIPVRIPTGSAKGNISTTFTLPPGEAQKYLIAVDLQPFRLATGTPIYADFKSVPYRDTEVIEWYRRVLQVQAWYARADIGSPAWKAEVAAAGITHVVLPADKAGQFPDDSALYRDRAYRIFAIR